jgi:hypothetical protein
MATVSLTLDIAGARLFSSGIPELVLINGTGTVPWPVMGYACDAAADEYIYLGFTVRNYGSGNLTLNITWYSRSGSTTGNVVMSGAIGCMTSGDAQSVESKTLATATTATDAVNGTAKGPKTTAVTISNLDSITNGDFVALRVGRVGSNGSDTMSGDAIIFGVEIQYSDT